MREYLPPGGENCADVLKRWQNFSENLVNFVIKEKANVPCQELYNQNSYEILLVSHGALMREVFKYLILDLKCEFVFDYECWSMPIENTSISNFTFEYKMSDLKDTICSKSHSIKCNYYLRNEHLKDKSETLCDL